MGAVRAIAHAWSGRIQPHQIMLDGHGDTLPHVRVCHSASRIRLHERLDLFIRVGVREEVLVRPLREASGPLFTRTVVLSYGQRAKVRRDPGAGGRPARPTHRSAGRPARIEFRCPTPEPHTEQASSRTTNRPGATRARENPYASLPRSAAQHTTTRYRSCRYSGRGRVGKCTVLVPGRELRRSCRRYPVPE